MLQLKDTTPFVSALALFPDPSGLETLYVTTKGTFNLGKHLEIADTQRPLLLADEFWDDSGESSLKYAGELHLAKPATDIVLVGSAHAPEAREVDDLDVFLSVGSVRKEIHVVGDREWTGSRLGAATTAPEPFATMPLVWERAFGGVHIEDEAKGRVYAEEENPVGRGFRESRRRAELRGQLAPNLIDPAEPERPACMGFVAANWAPRLYHAGTYDEAWQNERAPYLPIDFDARFFNAAHPDLICKSHLLGGEPVVLENLSHRSRLTFKLPKIRIDVTVQVSGKRETPKANLETVLFEPDEARMSMIWRAAMACDKKALEVEEVSIGIGSLSIDGRPL